jgi:hypothetical protein
MKNGNLQFSSSSWIVSVNVAKCLIERHGCIYPRKKCGQANTFDIAATTTNCSEEVLRLLEISDHAV